MARRYSREELLKLKESPLVVKPPQLPSAEEWMGPPPDPALSSNQARSARGVNRSKTDDSFITDAAGNRRPAFDSRRKSTTGLKPAKAPNEIVLGPPKTAFASASARTAARTTSDQQEEEAGGKNRNSHRDKYAKDASTQDREEMQNREARPPHNNNRRGLRDDSDSWSNFKHPKSSEDRDRRLRRTGDWEDGRGGERRERGNENPRGFRKTNGDHQNHERRNGHWRSQDGPLWNQDDDTPEDESKLGTRTQQRDFRDRGKLGLHAQGKGWGRTVQQDEDPLWMDPAEIVEEKKNGPTQADFEEFRAKMKAQDSKKNDIHASNVDQNQGQVHSDTQPTNTASKAKSNTALDLGDFSDKFYDILSQPKKELAKDSMFANTTKEEVVNAAASMAKSSKFSRLFNTDSTTKNAILGEPLMNASSEDKAGFQRILKLLDQQQQPFQGETTAPHLPNQEIPQASPAFQSPNRRQHEEPRSPPLSRPPQTKDTEFLLNLMRQPQRAQSEQSRPGMNTRREPETTPGMVPFSNLAMSPPQEPPVAMHSSGPPPGFFDEGYRHDVPRQDKLNPNGPPLPRGALAGMHDPFPGPGRPSALPPGLERRPPGFDHLPPGYSQHAQAAQQAGMQPPPGFPPPPPPPPPPQQRGISSSMGPGIYGARANPPGMPPPPGFTNMGGPPPPGFAGKGTFGHEAPFGAGGYDLGQAFGPPPGQQRR